MRDPERDYIARTIATVRNHKDADNCWPQWANAFADEIERLDAALEQAERERDENMEALLKTTAEAHVHAAQAVNGVCLTCQPSLLDEPVTVPGDSMVQPGEPWPKEMF